MGPFEIVLLLLGISAILMIGVAILSTISQRKSEMLVNTKLTSLFSSQDIKKMPRQECYDYTIIKDGLTYLVKVLYFNPKHELIITNPHYWCINQNIKNWKRSSKPVLVEGVKEFQDIKASSDISIHKIAIIYPYCYNITRYLNESDVEIVTPKKSAYGVYFVRFNELEVFFKN